MSEEKPDDLMSVIEDHERRLSALENLFKEKQPVPTKKISIAEFLKTKEPRTDVDTALAITYYLELTDGLANVNLEEIRAGFRKAATPIPPNLSETVRKNVAKGFLMDSGERKNGSTAWILTGTGKTYVEGNFRRK